MQTVLALKAAWNEAWAMTAFAEKLATDALHQYGQDSQEYIQASDQVTRLTGAALRAYSAWKSAEKTQW